MTGNAQRAVVETRAVAIWGQTQELCATHLIVDHGRPLEIGLRLAHDQTGITRWMSRQLITDGLDQPVGDGDVRIIPHHMRISIVLIATHPDDATTEFAIPRQAVRDAVDESWRQLPAHAEQAWTDRAVDDLICRCCGGRRG